MNSFWGVVLGMIVCVSVQASPKEESTPQTYRMNGNTFVYEKELLIHSITDDDWSRRSALGIALDARRCGSYLYITFAMDNEVKKAIVWVLVEDGKGGLRPVVPDRLFVNEYAQSPRLFPGIVLRGEQVVVDYGNHLVLPAGTLDTLSSCMHRKEFNT